ncbi:hypothetical protein EVAR_95291_1 [Eumeta japonica]|uniref:Uncharacterized protein n=1 Tax=Eumeta variegata TaxID=151549 RepID=A0A4C1U958_EUMVA|nr:hypothetical protein EVAR_95291_1 [Eumeta japonica]
MDRSVSTSYRNVLPLTFLLVLLEGKLPSEQAAVQLNLDKLKSKGNLDDGNCIVTLKSERRMCVNLVAAPPRLGHASCRKRAPRSVKGNANERLCSPTEYRETCLLQHEFHKWRPEYNCDGCTFFFVILPVREGEGREKPIMDRPCTRAHGCVRLSRTKKPPEQLMAAMWKAKGFDSFIGNTTVTV